MDATILLDLGGADVPFLSAQDLRASGCLANSFRYSTFPRYPHHFRRATFDDKATAQELEQAITFLVLAKALAVTKMWISRDAAKSLFGIDASLLSASATPEEVDKMLGFRQAARTITNVVLVNLPFTASATFLPRFPHLQ